mgnify:FL=1
MKIYAPVTDVNGIWASVRFINGVGETDNPRLIEWFKKNGYRVEETVVDNESSLNAVIETIEPIEPEIEYDENGTPIFEKMTPLQLRQWALENGLGGVIRNTRNKEKLLEIIRNR